MMHFGISENQNILLDGLDKVLSDNISIARLRTISESTTNFQTLKEELSGFGISGALVAPEYGGSGLKAIDAALISERLGYYSAPAPYIGPIVASVALNLFADEAQKNKYLNKLATGSIQIGVALSEHCGTKESSQVSCKGIRLYGRCLFVIDTDSDMYLVATHDKRLFMISRSTKNLSVRMLATIDVTRHFGEMILDGVEGDELKLDGGVPDRVAYLLSWAWVAIGADTLGACQRMLDDSVSYAKQRKQFDRVIGSFQAVKHMCAEMAAKIEPSRAMVWHAACSIDASLENNAVGASLCKSHLSEVGKFVSKTATEVHGGMGFTDLQGLHYWFKRIGINRQLLGSPEYLRREAAQTQGYI